MDEITFAAKELMDSGIPQVIVTCGKNGALLVNSKCTCHFPVLKVNAIDTTAAGDTLPAAIAVAL